MGICEHSKTIFIFFLFTLNDLLSQMKNKLNFLFIYVIRPKIVIQK